MLRTNAILLTVFLFIACSGKPPVDEAKIVEIKAKNEKLAQSNEVSAITRTAQKLEKQGRGLETYRTSPKAEAGRECSIISEGILQEITDLDARIQKLSVEYKNMLSPIIPDLNGCVACSKQATESCVKARASINKAIKEIYPQ